MAACEMHRRDPEHRGGLREGPVQPHAEWTVAETTAFVGKLRVYSISHQDDAGAWIRRGFPGLFYTRRWRTAFQNDFAARMGRTIRPYAKANHHPVIVADGIDGTVPIVVSVAAGQSVTLDAGKSSDPGCDRLALTSWRRIILQTN